jgi:hypothetical protein
LFQKQPDLQCRVVIAAVVLRWDEAMGCLVAAVAPEEAHRAQEVHLHEQVEDETGDDISSNDEFDGMVTVID